MKIKMSKREMLFVGANYFFLMLLVVVTLYPFYHVLLASISNPAMMSKHMGFLLKPKGFDLSAYQSVLTNPNIAMGYKNTLFNVVVGTSVNLFVTILTAYVLSRKGFLFCKFLTMLAIFTMFFNGGLIPFYLQVQALGLADTRWALIFPSAMSTFNMIVLRTAFLSLPASIDESARMDGANDFTILARIVIPLSIPTISIIILFYSVTHWNAWFNAMVFIRSRNLYPLQLILREILVISDTNSMTTGRVSDREMIGETIKYATIIVTILPILCVYPFLQRFFVNGIMVGAVKE